MWILQPGIGISKYYKQININVDIATVYRDIKYYKHANKKCFNKNCT